MRGARVKVQVAKTESMIAEGKEVKATTQLRKSSKRLLRVSTLTHDLV